MDRRGNAAPVIPRPPRSRPSDPLTPFGSPPGRAAPHPSGQPPLPLRSPQWRGRPRLVSRRRGRLPCGGRSSGRGTFIGGTPHRPHLAALGRLRAFRATAPLGLPRHAAHRLPTVRRSARNAPAKLTLPSRARACLAPSLAVTPRSLRSRFRALASCPLVLRLRGKNRAARSAVGGTMRASPRALATPSLPSPITGDGSLRHDPRSCSSPIRVPVRFLGLRELRWRPPPRSWPCLCVTFADCPYARAPCTRPRNRPLPHPPAFPRSRGNSPFHPSAPEKTPHKSRYQTRPRNPPMRSAQATRSPASRHFPR